MDAIRKAISEVRFRIPKAILEKAFINRVASWRQTTQTNIDDQILNLVIKARVLIDCDLVGGIQAIIPLEGLYLDKPDLRTTVVHIPKDRTQGRSIVSVLNVSYISQSQMGGFGNSINYGSMQTSGENTAVMGGALGMMNALDKIPVTSSAHAILISENTILVKDVISTPGNAFLKCILSNDDNLNNIQIRSYPAFCKLVEFAVKSYIYNTLVIEVDTAELQGGQALGIFKTVMEGYSDAEENYQDYLKNTWTAIAVMNDTAQYRTLLKLSIGSNR